ncbi:MAG: hypothetical protein IH971_01860, partial [Candidatus Marinimicrobia bacterium]|nr:hypothetical protein [Candidatus Neomarinimicrobiota bacterium]
DPTHEYLYMDLVERSPLNPDIIFAVEGTAGLFRSEDGGSTWELVYGGVGFISGGIGKIVWHPYKPGEVWLVVGISGPNTYSRLLGLSENGSSVKVDVDLDSLLGSRFSSWIEAIAFDVANADVLYAIASNGYFKSLDGGYDWEPIGSAIPDSLRPYKWTGMIADPRNPHSLFITYENSLYYSNDGLETVRLVEKIIADGAMNEWSGLIITTDQLFFGTTTGIYSLSIEGIR